VKIERGSAMKFSKAFFRKGQYETLVTYNIIFDPHHDIYRMSDKPTNIPYGCAYYGRQCNEDEMGEPVSFDDLPDAVKKQIAIIENGNL
jgi:hypothetical protein